jgi:hypothetical protein
LNFFCLPHTHALTLNPRDVNHRADFMRAAAKDDAFGWADVSEIAADGDDQMAITGETIVGGI